MLLTGLIVENAYDELRVWSASNIALLFHGQGLPLEDESHHPINTISQMTEKAQAVEVHLIKASNEEWRLVEGRIMQRPRSSFQIRLRYLLKSVNFSSRNRTEHDFLQ